jgi:hypothetical protein
MEAKSVARARRKEREMEFGRVQRVAEAEA